MEEDRMFLLARIVRLITAVVVGFIVVGIVLHLLDANSGNAIVSFVYDVAGWLVTPFKGIFSPDGAHARIAANWGLAAVVYALVGGVVSRLLARAGGVSLGRRRAAV
jgi:xanthine/uracil permease